MAASRFGSGNTMMVSGDGAEVDVGIGVVRMVEVDADPPQTTDRNAGAMKAPKRAQSLFMLSYPLTMRQCTRPVAYLS